MVIRWVKKWMRWGQKCEGNEKIDWSEDWMRWRIKAFDGLWIYEWRQLHDMKMNHKKPPLPLSPSLFVTCPSRPSMTQKLMLRICVHHGEDRSYKQHHHEKVIGVGIGLMYIWSPGCASPNFSLCLNASRMSSLCGLLDFFGKEWSQSPLPP